jgi:MFS superfamily sulfate permease-like transporter
VFIVVVTVGITLQLDPVLTAVLVGVTLLLLFTWFTVSQVRRGRAAREAGPARQTRRHHLARGARSSTHAPGSPNRRAPSASARSRACRADAESPAALVDRVTDARTRNPSRASRGGGIAAR